MALGDELRQHQLVENRHRAGIKAQLFPVVIQHRLRQDQKAGAHGRGQDLGEGVDIQHPLRRQRENGLDLSGEGGKLRVVVVLHDAGVPSPGPEGVFVPLGGRGGDAAGVAVKGRHMQNARGALFQRRAHDPVRAHGEKLAKRAVGLIDPADRLIAGVLQRVAALPPQKLHHQAVEILRPGADDDLLRLHRYPPAALQIPRQRHAQLRTAAAGGAGEDAPVVVAHHTAHGPRPDGKGEIRRRAVPGAHVLQRGARQGGGGAAAAEGGEIAAAGSGLGIALVAEQGVGVLHRDDAQTRLPGKQALGGKTAARGDRAGDDVRPQLLVELQICALTAGSVYAVVHAAPLLLPGPGLFWPYKKAVNWQYT